MYNRFFVFGSALLQVLAMGLLTPVMAADQQFVNLENSKETL